jgi:hypothetical protein
MNHVLIGTGIVFASGLFVGCSGISDHKPLPARSQLSHAPAQGESGEQPFQWRAEARELRAFANRHDVEAQVLLQQQSPPDARLIQQRRALARQLRVAATQIEQGAGEAGGRETPPMAQ